MYSEIYKRPYIEWFSGSPTILGVLPIMMRILWSPEFIIIIYFPVILLLWNKWPFQPWEGKSLSRMTENVAFFSVSIGGVKFGIWAALAWLTLPICFLKQVISVIQLIVACINTARLDESERERVNKWLAMEAGESNEMLLQWICTDWHQFYLKALAGNVKANLCD